MEQGFERIKSQLQSDRPAFRQAGVRALTALLSNTGKALANTPGLADLVRTLSASPVLNSGGKLSQRTFEKSEASNRHAVQGVLNGVSVQERAAFQRALERARAILHKKETDTSK